jgi:phosphate transport system substrate-binding protein
MRKLSPFVTGLLGTALAWFGGAGCGRSQENAVNVIGSTSILPFAEMLAEEFHRQNPGIRVKVQGGGSTHGLQAVTNGTAQVGMCSRSLTPEETGLTAVTIARDGIAIVVHPTNPLAGLTRGQIRGIFSGRLTNWKDVGGKDQAVRPITREEGSGTREAFTHLVMGKERIAANAITQESNGAVKELVKTDPGAIGFMSLGLVGTELKALAVDDVAASTAEVLSGKYPLVRPFLFVMKGKPGEPAQRLIDYVLSPAAQQLLEKEGLVRAQ